MKILEQALNKIKFINKKQKDFFTTLVQGLIGIVGKRTFRNLARYMEIDEHTFSRQMTKAFDFIGLNTELIKALKKDDDVLIAAQDSSFIPKSGKLTHGLDYFWNGSAGKVEKGLEIDVIAAVKVNGKKEAFTISAQQIPANIKPKSDRKKRAAADFSKIDFCLDHVKKILSKLIGLKIKYIVADAFFAKSKYINGVASLGLHVVSKLRKDARFRRLYTGPQKDRGRKRKFDNGKVTDKDFGQSKVENIDKEGIILQDCVVYSPCFDRLVKVVRVKKIVNNRIFGEALLFSTDLKISALQIYEFYVSRFQIEFIFRDAKGFTGLSDCQSRDKHRMNYHFNASLTALNVAKIQDVALQQKTGVQHSFSMANWTRKCHVEIVINRFISMFNLDPTLIKSHTKYENLLSFGNIKH